MLERLGRACARHHRIVLVVWLVVAVGVVLAARSADGQTYDRFTVPGTNSQQAIDLLETRFPDAAGASATVVFHATAGTLDDADAKAAVERSVANLKTVPHVTSVIDPLDASAGGYVSADKTIAYTTVSFDQPVTDLPPDIFADLEAATAPARDVRVQVAYSGQIVDAQDKTVAEGGVSEYADDIGLAFAAVILLFSLRSVVAMAVPIGVALFGITLSSSLLVVAEAHVVIGSAVPAIGLMIGLGVGIDYSLFIVSRYRQELHSGREVDDAVAAALGSAGSAVLFAGLSVCIAMVGLWLVGIPYVTTLGVAAAGFVIVAVITALTFLPAVLAGIGTHIDAWTLGHRPPEGATGGAAARWAHLVARHAGAFTIGALVLLGLMAAPTLRMDLGFPSDADDPPGSTQHIAYDLLATGFGPGVNGPLVVAVALPPGSTVGTEASTTSTTSPTTTAAADGGPGATSPGTTVVAPPDAQAIIELEEEAAPLIEALGKAEGVAKASPLLPNEQLTAGIIEVTPTTGPASSATTELVERLRDQVIPTAIAGTALADAQVYVGGQTAVEIDLTRLLSGRLAFVILGIIAGAFVLLAMVFRSLVVPATAAVMNLLSIGAAYGVLVAVFQWGWGKDLVGLDQTVPVMPFIPVMMFAILFGLSMDYEVFLLSRIREAWLRTGDGRGSVAAGVGATARVITSAALIMISVFLAFVTNPDPLIKMMGFGMPVAVLVDATIVRMLLVPAVMELFGAANWWMPAWLDRVLPHIAVEGPSTTEPTPADR